jgi:DNA polymerase-3 subunit epsilon
VSAIPLLERRLRGATIRVVDTETTGLGRAVALGGTEGLVELAIVQIDALFEEGSAGKPRLVFQSLVDPLVPGPWGGTPIHGLEPRDIADAPTWAELWERVGPWLADPEVVLCAHNAPFDRRFLDTEQTPVRPAREWLDTMRILQRLTGGAPGAAKLEAACQWRRIPLEGHRAAADAMATARLLPLLIREAYQLPPEQRPPERPTLGQWLDWQRRKTAVEVALDPPAQQGLFGGSRA